MCKKEKGKDGKYNFTFEEVADIAERHMGISKEETLRKLNAFKKIQDEKRWINIFIKKVGGNYYLCRGRMASRSHPKKKNVFYNWFPVRFTEYNNGTIGCKTDHISTPHELIGKKIRFKIEIIENDKA